MSLATDVCPTLQNTQQKAFDCTLRGPFSDLFFTQLSAPWALCASIIALISASTVCDGYSLSQNGEVVKGFLIFSAVLSLSGHISKKARTTFHKIIIPYFRLKINYISEYKRTITVRLRKAQLHWCAASHHLPKATSFEPSPQHRSFVPQAAMMFSLRSKRCCVCHTNDVVPAVQMKNPKALLSDFWLG